QERLQLRDAVLAREGDPEQAVLSVLLLPAVALPEAEDVAGLDRVAGEAADQEVVDPVLDRQAIRPAGLQLQRRQQKDRHPPERDLAVAARHLRNTLVISR